jgi:hypothetical protein
LIESTGNVSIPYTIGKPEFLLLSVMLRTRAWENDATATNEASVLRMFLILDLRYGDGVMVVEKEQHDKWWGVENAVPLCNFI